MDPLDDSKMASQPENELLGWDTTEKTPEHASLVSNTPIPKGGQETTGDTECGDTSGNSGPRSFSTFKVSFLNPSHSNTVDKLTYFSDKVDLNPSGGVHFRFALWS
jgi:hypothetical protein